MWVGGQRHARDVLHPGKVEGNSNVKCRQTAVALLAKDLRVCERGSLFQGPREFTCFAANLVSPADAFVHQSNVNLFAAVTDFVIIFLSLSIVPINGA